MHKTKKKRNMFLNHNDEILRYAVKITRSKRNFRKIMTAVKKSKIIDLRIRKKKIFINKLIMTKNREILYQHINEKKIIKNTRIKKMKKSFYKFSI